MCPRDSASTHSKEHRPADPTTGLSSADKETLRRVALDSIRMGLSHGRPLAVEPADFPPRLRAPGAVFVTLEKGGTLRGCIGSHLAERPLVEDVAKNAFAAAFRDPRFPALVEEELEDLEFHISLLTHPERLTVGGREELLTKLRPGLDGLLLEDPPRRSTFLPQVWDALPDPQDFLEELLLKGGFPRDHWSQTLQVSRYTVLEF